MTGLEGGVVRLLYKEVVMIWHSCFRFETWNILFAIKGDYIELSKRSR